MPNKREGNNYHFWSPEEDALIKEAYSSHPMIFNKSLTDKFTTDRLIVRAKEIGLRSQRFFVVHCNSNVPTEALIYMAGFLDADGSVYFNHQNNRYFMTFANDDKSVLSWMKSLLGNGATLEKKGKDGKHFQLIIRRTADVVYVLTGLMPYLHTKQDIASQAVKFNKSILENRKGK